MWYNENSDFFFQHILGDKDTFHLAFRKLAWPVSVPAYPVRALHGTLCQHDFHGRRIFQHRIRKWKFVEGNPRIPDFLYEEECLGFLRQLRQKWGRPESMISRIDLDTKSIEEQGYINEVISNVYDYIRVGFDQRPMTFSIKGNVETGRGGCEKYWDLRKKGERMVFEIYNEEAVICQLTEHHPPGDWRGRWLHYEKMPVELKINRSPMQTRRTEAPSIDLKKKSLLFRGPINGYTGYGLHSTAVIADLTRMGYDVRVRATHLNETYAHIPMEIRKHIVCQDISDRWELVLSPPGGFTPREGTRSVLFTLWESTRISRDAVQRLNRAYEIIVPCRWNACCLNACGIDRPIHIVPLGINADVFQLQQMDMNGPCVFGTAGRLESGGMRKGIYEVVQAFQKAFPNTKDARLRVKIFPDDDLPKFDDERIDVIRQFLPERELAKWYSGLTCFVSCSHGEAWGLMLHQALAVGRPVISVCYGGVTEFFSNEIGYTVAFRLVPAQGFYDGFGAWAEADESDIIEQMRRVYGNRAEAKQKGIEGSSRVSNLTWQNSNKQLLHIMKNIGMLM
jgi:glycosyltransferase involved in cell wall biosynthesis